MLSRGFFIGLTTAVFAVCTSALSQSSANSSSSAGASPPVTCSSSQNSSAPCSQECISSISRSLENSKSCPVCTSTQTVLNRSDLANQDDAKALGTGGLTCRECMAACMAGFPTASPEKKLALCAGICKGIKMVGCDGLLEKCTLLPYPQNNYCYTFIYMPICEML